MKKEKHDERLIRLLKDKIQPKAFKHGVLPDVIFVVIETKATEIHEILHSQLDCLSENCLIQIETWGSDKFERIILVVGLPF